MRPVYIDHRSKEHNHVRESKLSISLDHSFNHLFVHVQQQLSTHCIYYKDHFKDKYHNAFTAKQLPVYHAPVGIPIAVLVITNQNLGLFVIRILVLKPVTPVILVAQ